MPETKKAAVTPATSHDIRAILGPIDDEVVFVIQETLASKKEVQEAFTWLNDDDYMGAELGRPVSSRVRTVYEILCDMQDDNRER